MFNGTENIFALSLLWHLCASGFFSSVVMCV
jgi:hypothetical protein